MVLETILIQICIPIVDMQLMAHLGDISKFIPNIEFLNQPFLATQQAILCLTGTLS